VQTLAKLQKDLSELRVTFGSNECVSISILARGAEPFVLGCAFAVAFVIWRTGGLWFGERDHTHTTAVLYPPTVARSFVAATVAAGLGLRD
jgi:hypothetical protein